MIQARFSSEAHPQSSTTPSPIRPIFETVVSFLPNRDTMGGTAYLIVSPTGNILIDCPPWNDATRTQLHHYSGIRWFIFTHRGGMGNPSHIQHIQTEFDCEIVVQEQEAYLLPDQDITLFQHTLQLSETSQMIWTPGHSPGSSCLYYKTHTPEPNTSPTDKGILFTGRHLLPTIDGGMQPLRVAKTFHWFRQIRSIHHLLDTFNQETLHYACPGANTGFLRHQRVVTNVYQHLASLDLDHLRTQQPEFL